LKRLIGVALCALLWLRAGEVAAAVDLAAFRAAYGGMWTLAQSGNAFAIVGHSTVQLRTEHDARKAAETIAAGFGVIQLVPDGTSQSQGAIHYRFRPVVNRSPVTNREIVVALDRKGYLVSSFGRLGTLVVVPFLSPHDFSLAPFMDPLDFRQTETEKVALMKLLAELKRVFSSVCELKTPVAESCLPLSVDAGNPSLFDFDGPFLFATPEGFVIQAYRMKVRGRDGLIASEYIVGELHGRMQILERRLGFHPAKGARGAVFDPNPRATAGDLSISHATLLVQQSGKPKQVRLAGRYVIVDNSLFPTFVGSVPPLLDGTFSNEPKTISFASGMIYFHVDAMQRYVQKLGFTNLLSCPVEADPAMDGDNSLTFTLDPKKVSMGFGYVPQDDRFHAEDGDVIAHEYGHALQWGAAGAKFTTATIDGNPVNAETSAVGEGFGDYWAMSYFKSRNHKYGARRLESECYGEWAVDSGKECMRIIKLDARRCDFVPDGDPHVNGSIWTAALWKVRTALGRKDADRLALESHWYVPDRPDFCMAGMALLAADAALERGTRRRKLESIFRERGIFNEKDCRLVAP
jgi:fungalysin metallopeptidase (M36)